jgi:hypothetical protein
VKVQNWGDGAAFGAAEDRAVGFVFSVRLEMMKKTEVY